MNRTFADLNSGDEYLFQFEPMMLTHEKMLELGKCVVALKNYAKNRYSNIFPFDEHIAPCSVGYVNASVIDEDFIIAAGPMCPSYHGPETRVEFFKMIVENNVKVIVSLAKFEKGFSGCCNYLENKTNAFESELGKVSVDIVREEKTVGGMKRLLLVENEHKVIHYHFMDWPNYGVPKESDVKHVALLGKEILLEKKKLDEEEKENRCKVLVHCSGGVGRSGAFVTCLRTYQNIIISNNNLKHATKQQNDNNNNADLQIHQEMLSIIRNMRVKRHPWMVEGQHQYDFAFYVIKAMLLFT